MKNEAFPRSLRLVVEETRNEIKGVSFYKIWDLVQPRTYSKHAKGWVLSRIGESSLSVKNYHCLSAKYAKSTARNSIT
jgi:hypothetical protein